MLRGAPGLGRARAGGAPPGRQHLRGLRSDAQPGHARPRHRVLVRRDRRGRGRRRRRVAERRRAESGRSACAVRRRRPRARLARSRPSNSAPVVREALARAGVAARRHRRHRGHRATRPRRARSSSGVQSAKGSLGRAASRSSASITSWATCSPSFLRRDGDARRRRRSRSSASSCRAGTPRSTASMRPSPRRDPRARGDARRCGGRGVRQGREAPRPRLSGRSARRRLAARPATRRASEALAPDGRTQESLEFSFSGIKTQIARHVARHGRPEGERARGPLRRVPGARRRRPRRQDSSQAARAEGVARRRPRRRRRREPRAPRRDGSCVRAPARARRPAVRELHRQRRDDCLRRRASPRGRRARRWDLVATSRTALDRKTRKGRGAR